MDPDIEDLKRLALQRARGDAWVPGKRVVDQTPTDDPAPEDDAEDEDESGELVGADEEGMVGHPKEG